MVANVKIIDISRSYVPMDPKNFPETMHSTQAEDKPEERLPVIPYDGYNFMPTGYGYMSYFGINNLFGADALLGTVYKTDDALLLEIAILEGEVSISDYFITNDWESMDEFFAAQGYDNLIDVATNNYPAIELTEAGGPRVDDVFIIQTPSLSNIFVALTEDGIYTKTGSTSGPWNHVITLDILLPGEHKNWTKCVIGNEVYVYRAGEAAYWVLRAAEDFVPTEQIPNQLNMAAQQGIFKAGGRLGFWDSANSIAWSDVDDKTDFTPRLETAAGAAIFQQISGKITFVSQHGNGFIIYCTRSIVIVRRGSDAFQFWQSEAVFNENGVSYLGEIAVGQPDTIHFAFTTFGMVKIEMGKAEYIIPEVFTYLKESRQPVYLRVIEGRYLFFQLIDERYTTGIGNFEYIVVPSSTLTWKAASFAVGDISRNICKAMRAADRQFEDIYLFNGFGHISKPQANTAAQVPIWRDNLSTTIPIAAIEAFKAFKAIQLVGSYFFDQAQAGLPDTPFTDGAILKLGGNPQVPPYPVDFDNYIYTIPAIDAALTKHQQADTFAEIMTQEPNTQNFYFKQQMLWHWEDIMFNAWRESFKNKQHTLVAVNTTVYLSDVPINSSITKEHKFGPYISPDFFSEANKNYGSAVKSAWLQRSLTQGIEITFTEEIITEYSNGVELGWKTQNNSSGTVDFPDFFVNYAAANAVNPLDYVPPYDPGPPETGAYTGAHIKADIGVETLDLRAISHGWCISRIDQADADACTWPGPGTVQSLEIVPHVGGVALDAGIRSTLSALKPVYSYTKKVTQRINPPTFRVVEYDTCVHKQLGFTDITGHGHYELDGSFVQDDDDDEAPDYVDICDTNPKKKKATASFNGITIPSLPFVCSAYAEEVTINGSTYTFPDQVLTFPEGSFLMQDGSIEPIYPTFQGAFVYDLQYKKWGKMLQPHKLLVNYSPLNSQAGDQPVPFDIFSVNAGCLLEDGKIAIFDKQPADSVLRLGKVGYYRKGFTDCEEVMLQFRNPATGAILAEGSLDGKNLTTAITQISAYDNVNQHTAYFGNSARWFNIVVTGIYDIKTIDFKGDKKGSR